MSLLEEKAKREARNKIRSFYPDSGPFRRELYTKHLEFFAASKEHNEVAFLAGNRVGKTIAGAYKMACHMTGIYPNWWPGLTFDAPVHCWCSGDTAKTTRDLMQKQLLGPPGDSSAQGTGMLPGDLILRTSPKHGLADAFESVHVRHSSGGVSTLHFKSYDQGREAFQGDACHVIWLDEESEMAIYTECLLRTMTTGGIVYLTASPLRGLTELMLSFLPHLQPTAVNE